MVSKRRKPVQRGPKLSGQLVGTAGDQPLSLPLVRTLVMDDNLGDGDLGDLGDGDQPISLPLVLGPWWHSLKHRLFFISCRDCSNPLLLAIDIIT